MREGYEKRSIYLGPAELQAIEDLRDEREEEDGERPTWNSVLRTLLRRGAKLKPEKKKKKKKAKG
jgi:hypothetical protein